MLGNICMLLLSSAIFFFKINIFKKFFQEHYQCVKQFGFRFEPTESVVTESAGPDPGSNCLQRLSADDKSG